MFAISAARSEPTASRTAGMSSIHSSSVGSDGGRDRVGQAGAPLVEHDQPPERGEPLAELGERRHVPLGLHVAEPLVEQQDVGRPLPEDLVRQVEVAQAGVSGLGKHPA